MERIEELRFADFIERIDLSAATHYQRQVVIVDIQGLSKETLNKKRFPLKLETIAIVLVEKGGLKMNIDYIPYNIKENMLLILSQRHIMQIISLSEDFKGYFLLAKPNYLRSLIDSERPPLTTGTNSPLRTPVTQLDKAEFEILHNNLKRLQLNMQRSEHPYQAKLIEHGLADLIFETWNIRIHKSSGELVGHKSSNRENIVAAFFKLLLTNSRKEREVAFYADRLHVTPVYLSRAVKCVLGMPAIKIIHDVVLSDAELLLRRKETTIQQISEELNFPDQAAFSKFFKKNMGVSPLEYRKRYSR